MSKLDEIIDSWKTDCNIDETDLAKESLKIPKLHAKYYEMYTRENLLLTKTEYEYRRLLKIKTEYYYGRLSDEELKEFGWQQFDLKLMRQDLDVYLNADKDLIEVLLRLSLQKEKTEALKDIIKSIHSRPFVIKNCLDFLKWTSGA